MADAFCEMKGDTEKDRGIVRYRVKSLVKGTRREGGSSDCAGVCEEEKREIGKE